MVNYDVIRGMGKQGSSPNNLSKGDGIIGPKSKMKDEGDEAESDDKSTDAKDEKVDYKALLKNMAGGLRGVQGSQPQVPPYMQGQQPGGVVPYTPPPMPQAPAMPQGSLLEQNQKSRVIPQYMR